MNNEIRSEIRGLRLLVGAFVTVWATYWYVTGEIFQPLATQVVCAVSPESAATDDAMGGPFGDIADIVAALFYVVGTLTCWALTFAWNLTSSLFGDLKTRFAGVRILAENAINKPTSEPAEQPPDTPAAVIASTELTPAQVKALFRDTRDRLDLLEAWRASWDEVSPLTKPATKATDKPEATQ